MSTLEVEAPVPAPALLTREDLLPEGEVKWCPGCGNYGILTAFQKVLPTLGLPRERFVFISGIGCSSRFPYYINTFGFHTIHGRAPAVATGVKLANPELSVWVITGDGDALSIGGNHFIHALRRNMDLKIILFNNRIYGLTKGQYSPTSQFGVATKTSPMGVPDYPFSPVRMALAAGATLVARTFDADQTHLQATLAAVAQHKGAAFVEVWQNCPVFNDGVFDEIIGKGFRQDKVVYLEEGEPLRFGQDKGQVLIANGRGMQAVPWEQATPETVIRHDPDHADATVAFMLADMEEQGLPVPMGILRRVRKPSYDEITAGQGAPTGSVPDISALLGRLEGWTIDER
jgi:2-oxoglutarate ferredoxin oxidoreductase subunit beta